MTIPTMKPSPKMLPRDAKILSERCTDDEDVAYRNADDKDALIMCGKAHSAPRSINVHKRHWNLAFIGTDVPEFETE